MTPAQFRAALWGCRWSNRRLAAELCRDEHQVRRWANGTAAIPTDVAEWVQKLAEFHEANPAPDRKDRIA